MIGRGALGLLLVGGSSIAMGLLLPPSLMRRQNMTGQLESGLRDQTPGMVGSPVISVISSLSLDPPEQVSPGQSFVLTATIALDSIRVIPANQKEMYEDLIRRELGSQPVRSLTLSLADGNIDPDNEAPVLPGGVASWSVSLAQTGLHAGFVNPVSFDGEIDNGDGEPLPYRVDFPEGPVLRFEITVRRSAWAVISSALLYFFGPLLTVTGLFKAVGEVRKWRQSLKTGIPLKP